MMLPISKTLFDKRIIDAAGFYWRMREIQAKRQRIHGSIDAGTRGQVTGGKQLDGFANLVKEIGLLAGFRENEVFFNTSAPIPGYYRPQKNWDVTFIKDGHLVAAVELKSQSGSFGNNFNNRTEEVLGVAHDFWKAFHMGDFGVTEAPWTGYLFFLEDSESSRKSVALQNSPLPPMQVFNNTCYQKRYEILCEQLVLQRDYTSTALLISEKDGRTVHDGGKNVSAYSFFSSLYSHLVAHA